ncbi:MAG: type II secretion system F family protein [Acidimicrobiia bacterium]|nr:type II secretion system F family protein [Acidimicrobiia bacterium]
MPDLNGGLLLTSLFTAVAIGGVVWMLVRPEVRLAPRVRPYTITARTSLGRSTGGEATTRPGAPVPGRTFQRLFGPVLQSMATKLSGLIDSQSEEQLGLKLRQARMYPHTPPEQRVQEYRMRQLGSAAAFTASFAAVAGLGGASGAMVLLFAVFGFAFGASRLRGRIDGAIEERTDTMRMQIYTINQVLAMRVRAGGGIISGIGSLVERGTGPVIDDLEEVLRLHRSGHSATDAFHRMAEVTPEPFASRTYTLLGSAEDQGYDLAEGLLVLADDVREARRESMKRSATKRRAGMLIPILLLMAPVMLLFVGAPLPFIVLRGLQ